MELLEIVYNPYLDKYTTEPFTTEDKEIISQVGMIKQSFNGLYRVYTTERNKRSVKRMKVRLYEAFLMDVM